MEKFEKNDGDHFWKLAQGWWMLPKSALTSHGLLSARDELSSRAVAELGDPLTDRPGAAA